VKKMPKIHPKPFFAKIKRICTLWASLGHLKKLPNGRTFAQTGHPDCKAFLADRNRRTAKDLNGLYKKYFQR
jgi:hypothetical protein